MIQLPTSLFPSDPRWTAFMRSLAAFWDGEQRVQVLGVKDSGVPGATVDLRFKASLSTEYVQKHVQSTGLSKGGQTYSATDYVSSDRISCLTDRQQDTTVPRNGVDRYFIFLVPVLRMPDGTYVKFDGVQREDHMAFANLGT